MNVYEFANNLSRALPKGFVISPRPDHPHLYSPPDIIAGGRGTIVAIFIPRKSELRNPNELLARLTVTRLGLPGHTRCVALLQSTNQAFEQVVQTNFHGIIGLEDQHSLSQFIQDPKAVGNASPVPSEIREQAHRRYQLLYDISQRRRRIQPRGVDSLELFTELRSKFKPEVHRGEKDEIEHLDYQKIRPKPRNLFEYERSLIGALKFRKGLSPLSSINPFCVYSLRRSYALDMGVPYPLSIDPNILIVSEIPEGRYDRDKPLRAAAFAGWVLSAAESHNEITDLISRLYRAFDKRRI
jgi:hypothetical protein